MKNKRKKLKRNKVAVRPAKNFKYKRKLKKTNKKNRIKNIIKKKIPKKVRKTKSFKVKKKKIGRIKIRKKVSKKAKMKMRTAKRARIFKVKKINQKIKPVKIDKNLEVSKPIDALKDKSFFKAKIKVVGIGGGGGSIVSELQKSLEKVTFAIADTDIRSFKGRKGIKYFSFGQELTHGFGTGLNPDLAKLAAEKEKERISSIFEGQDIVILVASLGGGVGSGATQVFAEVSKNFGGIVLGIFTIPFRFEGKNKYKIAHESLKELRKHLNVSIVISNEKILKIIKADTSITEAFSMVNKSLIESLESLIDLIYSPGIINIDFADLKTILKGRGNLAFLNTVEAYGKDRAEILSKEILHNILYHNNHFKAEKILFNVSGGNNLSMFEVDKISRKIAEENPKAKIIFGVSKNTKYKNKIKTTLLMTGPPIKASMMPEVKIKKSKKASKKPTIKNGKKKLSFDKSSVPTERVPFAGAIMPVFNNMPAEAGDSRKLSIVEKSQNPKKAIRRTALEIKKAEAMEEKKKSQQEKEWEIPAFLRRVRFK